jgi:hypothetical protein
MKIELEPIVFGKVLVNELALFAGGGGGLLGPCSETQSPCRSPSSSDD